jgi:antitoxin component YwqK of YwqJK toxin-antitoxin module
MKPITIIIVLTLIYSCNNPKQTLIQEIPKNYFRKSSDKISIKNDVVLLNNKKYSGFLFELNTSKDTILVEGYIDGLLNGVCKKWYSKKQLMEERHYLGGQKNGRQIAFWQNGYKKFEFFAKNDAYEGELREYSENGQMFHLANYVKGQEEGSQKMWYDNGKIRANYVVIKGKRYGLLGTKNCKNVSDSIFVVR